jgi:hypothetical protein
MKYIGLLFHSLILVLYFSFPARRTNSADAVRTARNVEPACDMPSAEKQIVLRSAITQKRNV